MDVTELLLGFGPATRSRLAYVGEGVTKNWIAIPAILYDPSHDPRKWNW